MKIVKYICFIIIILSTLFLGCHRHLKRMPVHDLKPNTAWLMDCEHLNIVLAVDSIQDIWYKAKLHINKNGIRSTYAVSGFQKGDIIPSWYMVDTTKSDVFFIRKERDKDMLKLTSLKAIDGIGLCDSVMNRLEQ